MSEADEDLYLCIGICLPDADEAYCIGCGRPWHLRQAEDWDDLRMPSPDGDADEDEGEPPAPA
ncbi:MAG: hypothetical protein AB1642_01540 [Pseudomonadota bacterium]